MADNVSITAGSGTSIASDDIGGIQFQRIKLTVGPDGTNTGDLAGRTVTSSLVATGATDVAAYVDPRVQRQIFTITPTISTTPAYTAGDCLGGLQTISNAARFSGGGGVIRSVTVLDKTQAQRSAFDIFLFNGSITATTDNAAFAGSDADMAKCIGVISILTTDYNTAFAGTPLNSVAFKPDTKTNTLPQAMAIPYYCSGSTTLYAQLVTRGTPTYTSTTDIVVQLNCTLD